MNSSSLTCQCRYTSALYNLKINTTVIKGQAGEAWENSKYQLFEEKNIFFSL